MKKDRAATEEKIYQSFLTLLEKNGPQAVGINAIAKEAGVSKGLIYRYFGGMKGLLLALAKRGDIFKTVMQLNDDEALKVSRLKAFAKSGTKEVRENKLTQEILRWQLLEHNDDTRDLFKFINKEIADKFSIFDDSNPLNHALQLMTAGYLYLTLLSKFNKKFITTDLRSEETWSNFDNVIEEVINLFESSR